MKKIGLFLIACLVIASCSNAKKLTVNVKNDSKQDRTEELVEVDWADIARKVAPAGGSQIIVQDAAGKQLPYQLVYNGGSDIQRVVFPATVSAGESVAYTITTGTPEVFKPKVYGRLVPERKDDFAWENDKIAFRMYGPALQATGEISNGIDIWAKSTNELVVDKWYKNDLSGVASYHQDHGEGLDFYKVGRTLGGGALAPYANDTLWLGKNFVKQEVLDNGPLRVTFRLTYAPFDVNGKQVTETRTISLDANSQLSKVVERFDMDTTSMQVASGIILRPEEGGIKEFSAEEGYMAYSEPNVKDKGIIYVATVSPSTFGEVKENCGHLLALNEYAKGSDYTYYTGGGWSKGGFATPEEWFDFVKEFAYDVQHPLVVSIAE